MFRSGLGVVAVSGGCWVVSFFSSLFFFFSPFNFFLFFFYKKKEKSSTLTIFERHPRFKLGLWISLCCKYGTSMKRALQSGQMVEPWWMEVFVDPRLREKV